VLQNSTDLIAGLRCGVLGGLLFGSSFLWIVVLEVAPEAMLRRANRCPGWRDATVKLGEPSKVLCGCREQGSILFLHRSDGMLHHDPGEGATPIGVTTRDLAPHSVVRPSCDGFILLDGQFNLTEEELALL